MAGINRESGDNACQQAHRITATVADPNLAGQYAQRLASEILARTHF
jgi:hypothetical protein